MQQADRVLALEGARNLRDLGGLPTLDGWATRWRTLFRSDSTHRFTPAAQQYLVQLGLRTIIDLDRRWGGADQYLLAHGLSHEEIERLRELLTARPIA
jgi:Tyrosine phosphatase family